jgi:hypothetical protein
MRRTLVAFGAAVALAAVLAAPGRAAEAARARDVLPAEDLVSSSVAAIRDQASLNTRYYLADEAVLGLGRKTDAVFARYRLGTGEALLLVVAYPSSNAAGRVYGRFGGDFFSGSFDPTSDRVVETIETGDWAGAARKGRFLIIVLEAPDKAACEDLLRRAEDKAPADKVE